MKNRSRYKHQSAAFWDRVTLTSNMRDCWIWTGPKNEAGYGLATFDGRQAVAHRFAWSFAYGRIPKGRLVLHACDEASCVNPRHLRLGDVHDNSADRAVMSKILGCMAERDRDLEKERIFLEQVARRREDGRRSSTVPGPNVNNLSYSYPGRYRLKPATKQMEALLEKSNLSTDLILYIRALYQLDGMSLEQIVEELAPEHAVPFWQVRSVVVRHSWQHLP